MTERIVTIDGPSGSGKTTLGRRLAQALRLPLLDTGLLYRAVMVAAVRSGIEPADTGGLIDLAARTAIEVNTEPRTHGWQVLVDGSDPGDLLRDPRHTILLSTLSQIAEVREALLDQQRSFARLGVVAVGRDCGTVVFPWAPVKLYLEAATAIRAKRRADQLGIGEGADAIDLDVSRRDAMDSERAVAPLRPAADAHMIDTGTMSIEDMVEEAVRLCAAAGIR